MAALDVQWRRTRRRAVIVTTLLHPPSACFLIRNGVRPGDVTSERGLGQPTLPDLDVLHGLCAHARREWGVWTRLCA